MIRINVKPSSVVSLNVEKNKIGLGVSKAVIVSGEREGYEGAYEVTPKVEAQTLNTANKFLRKDVSIFGIPFFDVSNESGGSTVYIGTEVFTDGN